MKARDLHPWSVSPEEAIALQLRLAPLAQTLGEPRDVRLVAGVDIAVGGASGPGRAAVVVLRFPDLEPIEQAVVEAEVRFPYVPGLLSFREIPLLLPALARLRSTPDLIMVDGQGIAHPRRLGIATHLGLLLDVTTIGCAKSRLTGRPAGPIGAERGAYTLLVDRRQTVGVALRTRPGTNPVYVSPGHKIGVEAAMRWTLALTGRYRIPEPTRLAHLAAAGKHVAPESVAAETLDD